MLALSHLPVNCHWSGHILPPLLYPEGDGPSLQLLFVTPPPAESLGNQVGRLTFTLFELLGPCPYDVAQQMPLSSALGFLVSGLVPWHLRNPDQSTCVSRLYMAWTQAFSCPPSCICLILTVAWFGALSRVCLHVYLPRLFCFSAPSGCVHLYVAIVSPSPTDGLFLSPGGMRIDYEGALSRRLHVLTYGPAWTSTSVHILLFECP